MLKLLLRILLHTLTILVVIVAGLFTVARVGSLFAPNYVDNLNQRFTEEGLEFSELNVRWRGINPVVEIGGLTGSNFDIEDITAELDILASFWRNTYVFRTIQIGHVSVVVSQESACTIDFPDGEGSFRIGDLIRHTDNIDLSFSSTLECGSSKFEHEGFFRTIRKNKVYRLHAMVNELGDCEHCSISLLYEATTSGFWRREEERILNVQAHDFVLPTRLLGWDFLKESFVNAQILMNGTSESAALVGNIEIQPKHESSVLEGLHLDLSFKLQSMGVVGRIDASLLDHNQNVVSRLEHTVQQDRESNYVHGWSHDIPIDTVDEFLNIFGVSDHLMQEWMDGLAPSGILSIVQWVQDESGIRYRVLVDELFVNQYANVPSLTMDSAVIAGRGAMAYTESTAQQINLEEVNFLSAPMSLAAIDFLSVAMWQRDYVGWSIFGQWEPTANANPIDFNIDVGKRTASEQRWFRFALASPSLSTTELHPYLSSILPAEAFDWFEQSVAQGQFEEAGLQFVLNSDATNQNQTSLEITALVKNAEVVFLEDWPEVVQGTGRLWLTRDGLTIEVSSAYTHGNHIEKGTIFLPLSEPRLDLDFTADMTFLLLQSYLAESPLTDLLPIDPLEFDGSGAIDLDASIKIPLLEEREDLWDVNLELVLADVLLDIKPANIQLDDMYGTVGYQYPDVITSSQLTAKYHDDPVSLTMSTRKGESDSNEVVFAFELNTSVSAVANLTGDWLPSIASGSTHVSGEIVFPTTNDSPATVDIHTDLVGVALSLPKPYHKIADQNRPMQVQMRLDDPMIVDVTMDEVKVRSAVASDGTIRGSVGLSVPPPQLSNSTRDWVVAGTVDELVFETDQKGEMALPEGLDIQFVDLHIHKLVRARFQLHDLIMNGTFGGASSALTVTAEEGNASLSREQGQDWQLSVERLRFWHSAFDTPDDTPMDPTIFLQLPKIDVSIQELYMFTDTGEAEEFGSWAFELDTTEQEVLLRNIQANIRGVTLDTQDRDGIVWDTEKNETRFNGVISGANLLHVLPKFDVVAEIESEDFTVNSELVWPGSPFDVNPLKLSGRIHGDANNGTLLEIDAGQGILRLLSMFNIAPIIQRMDFDPSAMFAKGYSFDRILFDVTLDNSNVVIQEPIHIKGRSSEVLFTGNANLTDESVMMDVVVRLPISTNLKWYVALITGNPTAFLGTLIGSRIFRPQLNQLASAKYRVEGSFETPEIELIGIFDDDLTGNPIEDDTIIEE
ncbi:MAG: hypothetical protein F4Z01_03055 [Gammaproteobacteria bacterium]|nr:hypothetical protein [Gammaproteobacteria bacterium]